MTVILPQIVHLRWVEALHDANPLRWRSLANMCASMAIKIETEVPGLPISDDLRCLSDLAYGFYLELMPDEPN